MSTSAKAARCSQFRQQQIRSNYGDFRDQADESNLYETYDIAYNNEEQRERYERRPRKGQLQGRFTPDEPRDTSAGVARGTHVARIEIACEQEEQWNHGVEHDTVLPKAKNRQSQERCASAEQHANPQQSSRSIPPPPPCMPKFEVIDGYKPSQNQVAARKQRDADNVRGTEAKRRVEHPHYNSDPPIENQRYTNPLTKSNLEEKQWLAQEKTKVVVVNLARTAQSQLQRPSSARTSERNRESTKSRESNNPFHSSNARQPVDHIVPHQQAKNVQEVVLKMNSGQWPIKTDDEGAVVKAELPPSQKSCVHLNEKAEVAKNWEVLPRNRASPHEDRRERIDHASPKKRNSELRFEASQKRIQHKNRDDGDSSDRSDTAERTTVSTDSAFGSDTHALSSSSKTQRMLHNHQQKTRLLEVEAEKLLIYFKGHRPLLNYLGIGLTEMLWNRISALPLCEVELKLADVRNSGELVERQLPAQSPRLVALERQLRTDDLNFDWEDRSRGYLSDGERDRHDRGNAEFRSGRFVKKSAAALIAKKQGLSQISPDEPSSSEIVDPRIAGEIQALREREDELRRSRTELGLPTLDEVMNRSFFGHGLRAAHSCDQLHQLVDNHFQNERYAREHEQERCARSSLAQVAQKESRRNEWKHQQGQHHQKSEEKWYAR